MESECGRLRDQLHALHHADSAANSNADGDLHTDPDEDLNQHADCHVDIDTEGYVNSHEHANGNFDADTCRYRCTNSYSHSEPNGNSGISKESLPTAYAV